MIIKAEEMEKVMYGDRLKEFIPEKKKSAVGVRGMKLDKNDELKNIYVLGDGENEMVEVKGKEFALNRLHIGNRDTKGVKK